MDLYVYVHSDIRSSINRLFRNIFLNYWHFLYILNKIIMFYFFHPSAGHAIADAYVLGLEDTMIVCDIQSQEIVEEHHSKPLIGQLRQLQRSH